MDNEFTRRDVLVSSAVAGLLAASTSAMTAATPTFKPEGGTLRERADRKGLLCGSAVSRPALNDVGVQKVLAADANIVVPENELKWSRLQPTADGPLNFGPAEEIYAFAKAHDIAMRGHTLTWSRGQPDWAVAKIAEMTAGQTGDFLTDYVTKVVSHWKGRLVQWDVINEPVLATGELLEKVFSGKLGEQYMDIALKATAEADPGALRMVNQTLIAQEWWWEDRQRDQTLRIVEAMLKRGAPLQGFGYEGHIKTKYGFSEAKWAKFLEELKGMGLKFMITELDVNDNGTIGDVAKRDAASASLVKALLDVSFSFDNCLGLLTWAPSDKYSWLLKAMDRQRTDGAQLRPSPRDDDFKPKPIWNAIADALDAAPKR